MNPDPLALAVNLHAQGCLTEAGKLYEQILAAKPGQMDACHMLGVLRAEQGRNQEAYDLIASAVLATPGNVQAMVNLGNVLNALCRCEEALQIIDRALAAAPDFPDAWCNRGNVLQEMGRLEDALASYDRALFFKPDFMMALNNRGNVLLRLKQYDAALGTYEYALALDSDFAEVHVHRADALQRLCRYDEALTGYQRALELSSNLPSAWNNRGVAMQQVGRLQEAGQCFVRAAQLAPGMPEARVNRGQLYLLQQDFVNGWPLYEARKEMLGLDDAARSFVQPLWTGAEDIRGKTVFVYIQRGLGDAIQFYRYAPLIQARGANVVLSVNDPLLPLLQSAVPRVNMIGLQQVPELFDYHISLMSAPLALVTDIPQTGRYLAADPARVALWRERIGVGGYRIAITWQGLATSMGAEGKSFPLSALTGIAAIPGMRLISLQKNDGVEQLDHLPPGMAVETFTGFDDGPGAFLDSAAIMENCDLVISCDTALAHLAGALGVPNWLALKYVPEWRWFLGRSDTPWYPKTRLFRQVQPGEWDSVFYAMEAELRQARR